MRHSGLLLLGDDCSDAAVGVQQQGSCKSLMSMRRGKSHANPLQACAWLLQQHNECTIEPPKAPSVGGCRREPFCPQASCPQAGGSMLQEAPSTGTCRLRTQRARCHARQSVRPVTSDAHAARRCAGCDLTCMPGLCFCASTLPVLRILKSYAWQVVQILFSCMQAPRQANAPAQTDQITGNCASWVGHALAISLPCKATHPHCMSMGSPRKMTRLHPEG